MSEVEEPPYKIRLEVVDAAAEARMLFGAEGATYISGRDATVPDWRLQVTVTARDGREGKTAWPGGGFRISAEDVLREIEHHVERLTS